MSLPRIIKSIHSGLLLFVGLCALALSLTAPLQIHAQGMGVRVQPTMFEERLDPGAVVEGAITVTNESVGAQTYFIGTRNILSMEESGRPVFSTVPSSDPLEAAAWIKPSVTALTLAEGESRVVPFTIQVPTDASPGSHFAALFVSRDADTTNETGASVGFQVASLVNLRITGDVIDSIMVREFATDKALYTSPEVVFSARIENNGTVHQRPLGIITVYDMLGNEVGSVQLNEGAGGVMPSNERVYESSWSREGFAFGRYRAVLDTVFGDTDRRTVSNTTTFWIVPVRELGGVLAGLVVLLLVLSVLLRLYVRRALARAGLSASAQKNDRAYTLPERLIRTFLWLALVLGILFIGVIVFFA